MALHTRYGGKLVFVRLACMKVDPNLLPENVPAFLGMDHVCEEISKRMSFIVRQGSPDQENKDVKENVFSIFFSSPASHYRVFD